MRTLRTIILSLGMVGSLMASEALIVGKGANLAKIGLDAKAWESVKAQNIAFYPQSTIEMSDADVMKLNAENKAKNVSIKSLSDGENIAFLLKWQDGTKSVQEGYSSTAYGDGFAVQFPTVLDKLPYIGMGSEGRAVVVHLQKATGKTYEPNGNKDVFHQVNSSNQNTFEADLKKYKDEVAQAGNGDYQRVYLSEGFRSTTQLRDNSEESMMEMKYDKGFWTGVIVRKIKSANLDLSSGNFPVAFAVWDGEKKNRDGMKLLSPWVEVKVQNGKSLNSMAETKDGDVKNGETVMMENCSACHQYKEVKNAPNYMAPNLSNIGGYANESYLIESIIDPSAVVVPGYNTTAHPNFPWYTVDKGVRSSTMPPFSHLDAKSLKDLVAYLKTLKVEVSK